MNTSKKIWTIGHSTRTINEFVFALKTYNISLLADIRSLPGSRKFPHFNKEELEISLPKEGIQYTHLKDLGGRRKVNPDSKNTAWRLPAFRGYADYMETEIFINAVRQLEELASQQPTAFMCSEFLWWRCHRSLVADWLKINGWNVYHIFNNQKFEGHPYTQPAKVVNGKLIYS